MATRNRPARTAPVLRTRPGRPVVIVPDERDPDLNRRPLTVDERKLVNRIIAANTKEAAYDLLKNFQKKFGCKFNLRCG